MCVCGCQCLVPVMCFPSGQEQEEHEMGLSEVDEDQEEVAGVSEDGLSTN